MVVLNNYRCIMKISGRENLDALNSRLVFYTGFLHLNIFFLPHFHFNIQSRARKTKKVSQGLGKL